MAEEVYEKKVLDRLADRIVDGIARVIDLVKPGWSAKNKSRLDEWKLMLYALNRSPPGIIGVFLISIFVIIAILGPVIAPLPYDAPLSLCSEKAYLAPPCSITPSGINCTVISIGEECASVIGVSPGNYTLILGADDYGRDLFSRILYGARTSFMVSVLVMAVGPTIGIILGLISGYYGGVVDEVIMRITDIFLAFPGLILAIALSAVLPSRLEAIVESTPWLRDFLLTVFAVKSVHVGPLVRLFSVIVALWIVWWPPYARLVRGMVLSAKENTYVEAARAIGVPAPSIMFRHILPNIIGPVLVYVTLDFGGVILTEAGLSFLGLGAVPPLADWGRIIYDGAQWFPNAWWLVFYPGLAIFLAVLGFNLLGDSLRDVLDPRTRRRIEFRLKKGGEE